MSRRTFFLRYMGSAMKSVFISAAFAMLIPLLAASSERPSAGTLLTFCKKAVKSVDEDRSLSNQDVVDGSVCLGYLGGIRDALTMNYKGHGDAPVMCLPQAVTTSQLARIYVKWAEANPEHLHEDQYTGVFMAFFPKYACPE